MNLEGNHRKCKTYTALSNISKKQSLFVRESHLEDLQLRKQMQKGSGSLSFAAQVSRFLGVA